MLGRAATVDFVSFQPSALAPLGLSAKTQHAIVTDMGLSHDRERATLEAFGSFQRAFGQGVPAVLAHYADDAVLIAEDVYIGRGEIQGYLEGFVRWWPAGASRAFEVVQRQVAASTLLLRWRAEPWVQLGVDTFVFDGALIRAQTVALQATLQPLRRAPAATPA